MQKEDTKIIDQLDHNIPEFIDPDDEPKKEQMNRSTEVEFVPIIKRKPNKKHIAFNIIKMFVWCILLPFCINTGVVYYFAQEYVKVMDFKQIGQFLIIFFTVHLLAAFWIDWITGRKKQ
jgi:hypothetical protein